MTCETPPPNWPISGELLGAGAGGADDADVARADDVREGERDVVDDRGAAVGAHHEQLLGDGFLLEALLLLDRDVVAEEHDVDVVVEALVRDAGGILAGDGDDRQVELVIHLDGGGEGRRIVVGAAVLLLFGQQFVDLRKGGGHDVVVFAPDGDEEVVGGDRLELGRHKAEVVGDVPVEVGAHADEGLLDAVEFLEVLGDEHEGYRVVIGILLDIQLNQCRFLQYVRFLRRNRYR